MKEGMTIRKSRRGKRTTFRIVLKGKAADGFIRFLLKKGSETAQPDQPSGGDHA